MNEFEKYIKQYINTDAHVGDYIYAHATKEDELFSAVDPERNSRPINCMYCISENKFCEI